MQGERTDRRAPTSPRCTVARGNEPPMNPYERRGGPHKKNGPKYVAYVALYGARVAERTRRVAVTHSHRPTIYGPGLTSSPTVPARVHTTELQGWLLRAFVPGRNGLDHQC